MPQQPPVSVSAGKCSRAQPLGGRSDERLVGLSREGDKSAFEVLVRRYEKPLRRYCRRFVLSEAEAEEVLQQALFNAWLAIRAGTEVRELRPWLYRIAHNVALNSMRPELPRGESGAEPAAVGPGLDETLRARTLLAGVAALPTSQREVVLRAALRGDSYEQVAGALGISDGAVRGLLQRARASLRASMAAISPLALVTRGSGGREGSAALGAAPLGGGGGALSSLVARGAIAALGAGMAIGGGLFAEAQRPQATRTPGGQSALSRSAPQRSRALSKTIQAQRAVVPSTARKTRIWSPSAGSPAVIRSPDAVPTTPLSVTPNPRPGAGTPRQGEEADNDPTPDASPAPSAPSPDPLPQAAQAGEVANAAPESAQAIDEGLGSASQQIVDGAQTPLGPAPAAPPDLAATLGVVATR